MIAGTRQLSNGENRDRNGHVLVWEQPGLEENDKRPAKKKGIQFFQLKSLMNFLLYFYLDNLFLSILEAFYFIRQLDLYFFFIRQLIY